MARTSREDPTASYTEAEEGLYQDIVRNALEATGVRFVNLARVDPHTLLVTSGAWVGNPDSAVQVALEAARRLVPGFAPNRVAFQATVNPLVRAVLVDGRTLVAPFEQFASGATHPGILRIASLMLGVRYTLGLPLRVGGRVGGTLAFHSDQPFTPSQQRTAEAFGRQAALTLENAELYATIRRQMAELRRSRDLATAAEERLRRELAEVLHSRVQGRLLAAWHRLVVSERLWGTDPTEALHLVAEARDEIDAIREQEVRQVSYLLHPAFIREGLVPAVRTLVDRFGDQWQISLSVDAELQVWDTPLRNRLPEPLRLAAYRVVEEALNNALRHAHASAIHVALGVNGAAGLCVSVSDDGVGFDPSDQRPGLGLAGIEARTDQAGGVWHLRSAPGHGTTVTARFPLPGDALGD